jgi:uncharacterized coiled-coil DUF342 family protein
MDKNTENAVVNALGEIHVTLDHMKNDLSDVKKNMNTFAEKVIEKLDAIDSKITDVIGLKKEIEKHSSDIETIKKHLNIH